MPQATAPATACRPLRGHAPAWPRRRRLAGPALLAALLLALLPGPGRAQAATPAIPQETHAVPGLAAPAQILLDTWGVPHIYASSTDDAYFVQGYNAARDRLFQIDLWRRRGLGLLASVYGPNFVEQDRAARLLLYRGSMAREWQAYGRDAERIAGRFVAGINAWVDRVAADPSLLPLEFRYFGYAPAKWQPEDVVRIRSHGLARNLASEFARAALACRGNLAADGVRIRLSPPWQTRVPEGLDPCLPPEVLRTYGLATQGLQVSGRDDRRAALEAAPRLATSDAVDTEGSNAWVVAPARSATGRPILANDPHRLHTAPSLRYIVHLSAPGLDVIGGGEPALPGVSIGHNGRIAFGLTIFAVDQEDLYVHETHPARDEIRYQGRWEPMRTVTEQIPVRGQAAQPVRLQFTRHGPVLHHDRQRNRAYSLRAASLEPGMAPYFGSTDYMLAKDFAAFRRAMGRWGAPAENQVYADTAGNIGWVTGGLAPRRPTWDGLLPVPGDGRHEWAGFWPGDQLPWAYNPPAGWFASANEQNLPPGYPWRERKLGFEWSPASRHQRLAEVLGSLPKVSLEDSMRLQNDVLSVPARRVLAVLRPLRFGDERAAAAARLLASWDARVAGDSAAAALFEAWWSRHLGDAVKEALLAPAAAALVRAVDGELLPEVLENPARHLGRDAAARVHALLEKSLARAWDDMLALAGPDPARWRWDGLHHSFFPHPLANAADAATQARLNVGPLPKQGSGDTVNLSSYEPRGFRQFAGPSFRMVLDVGEWDNSRAINAPGQSGDPSSPHYRDLAPLWQRGEYFPLLYTRSRIEAALARRIELVPAVGSPRRP